MSERFLGRAAASILIGLAITLALAVAIGEGLGETPAPTADGSTPPRLGGDYPAFHAAGSIVLSGDLDELYDAPRQEAEQVGLGVPGYLAFAYPPFVAVPYAPLAAIGFRAGYVAYTLLLTAAVAASIRLLSSPVPALRGRMRIALTVCLCAYPLFHAVRGGQNTALSLLAFAAVWRFLDDDRDLAAGVVIGLLLFRPQYAIPLLGLMILDRRWRAAAGAVGTGVATWIGTAAVFGVDWIGWWLDHAVPFIERDAEVNAGNSISILGFLQALLGRDDPLALTIGGAGALAVVGALMWLWRHPDRFSLPTRMGAAAIGIPLISPHTMFYDAGLLMIGAAALLAGGAGSSGATRRTVRVIAVVFGLAYSHALFNDPDSSFDATPLALVMIGSFVAWMVASVRAPHPDAIDPLPPVEAEVARDLSIIVPAYNEARRIGPTLESIASFVADRDADDELIVVDDGSDDDTIAVVEAHRHLFARLEVIASGENRGKGHAVRAGMLAASGRHRLFLDADSSTHVREYDRLMDAAAQVTPAPDVVIGSVAVAGANVTVRQPGLRPWLGRLANRIIRTLAVPGIEDTQRGFKVFTAEAAVDIFGRCESDGWAFDVEALALAIRLGYRVLEVPVTWEHREESRVKPWAYVFTMFEVVAIAGRVRRTARRSARVPSEDVRFAASG